MGLDIFNSMSLLMHCDLIIYFAPFLNYRLNSVSVLQPYPFQKEKLGYVISTYIKY